MGLGSDLKTKWAPIISEANLNINIRVEASDCLIRVRHLVGMTSDAKLKNRFAEVGRIFFEWVLLLA